MMNLTRGDRAFVHLPRSAPAFLKPALCLLFRVALRTVWTGTPSTNSYAMNILVTAWLVLGVAAMPRATAQELPGQPRGESMTGDAFTFVVLGDSRPPGGRPAHMA